MNIADLRKEYTRATLNPTQVHADPVQQFDLWLQDAVRAQVPEPTAMTLATADAAGKPSARIVLLKGVSEGEFVFFSNYTSRKGLELQAQSHASLLFFWPELERQVRIEGETTRASAAESDVYYQSRPLSSRIGAWASPQSESIPDRAMLEQQVAATIERFGEHPPRPPYWGGYRLRPHAVEFWQGRPDRLHDRIRYQRNPKGWHIERLAP